MFNLDMKVIEIKQGITPMEMTIITEHKKIIISGITKDLIKSIEEQVSESKPMIRLSLVGDLSLPVGKIEYYYVKLDTIIEMKLIRTAVDITSATSIWIFDEVKKMRDDKLLNIDESLKSLDVEELVNNFENMSKKDKFKLENEFKLACIVDECIEGIENVTNRAHKELMNKIKENRLMMCYTILDFKKVHSGKVIDIELDQKLQDRYFKYFREIVIELNEEVGYTEDLDTSDMDDEIQERVANYLIAISSRLHIIKFLDKHINLTKEIKIKKCFAPSPVAVGNRVVSRR